SLGAGEEEPVRVSMPHPEGSVITLRAAGGARVEGRVFANGAPVVRGLVELEPRPAAGTDGESHRGVTMHLSMDRTWTGLTDEDGAFSFEPVAPGRYLLGAAHMGQSHGVYSYVDVVMGADPEPMLLEILPRG